MRIKQYMVSVYAVLVKNDKRQIENIPEAYVIPRRRISRGAGRGRFGTG